MTPLPSGWRPRTLLGLGALFWLTALGVIPASADPLRLVCLGDSITQGRGTNPPTYSWRYPLWKTVIDAEAEVDFVGSLRSGFNGDPNWADYRGLAFDRDHEGHWGWTTRSIRENLANWLQGYTPDVALILLGTNDGNIYSEAERIAGTIGEHRQLVNLLRADNPSVTVVLGGAFQEWAPFPDLRAALRGLAEEMDTEESPVLYVDHSPGWVSNPETGNTHTVDWVHPNQKGDALLAKNWWTVLRTLLPYQYGLWKLGYYAQNPWEERTLPLSDPDRDGVPNLQEYNAGTHPGMKSSGPGTWPTVACSDGVLRYSLVVREEATDLRYVVRGSRDGNNWSLTLFDSATEPLPPAQGGRVELSWDVRQESTLLLRLELSRIAAGAGGG